MNKWQSLAAHPLLLTLIRVLVGAVFLVFGFVKAIEPLNIFYDSIAAYQMVPDVLIEPFGLVVLVFEIAAGLFLTVGLFTKWSNRVIIGMLAMFIIAIAQAMIRGIYLPDCGCSGSLISLGETPAQVLTRDVLMLVGVVWLEVKKRYGFTIDSYLSKNNEKAR